MSVYDTVLYSKDLEERVEELELAIERAMAANTLEQALDILREVS